MSVLQFGDLHLDADLVAFDKDGTLVDLELMWGRLAVAWVERLVAGTGNKELERDLYSSLGYDPRHRRTKPQSPLAIATRGQLRAIAAGALYRHGIPWTQAEEHAVCAFETSSVLPLADLIQPTGNVSGIPGRHQRSAATDRQARLRGALLPLPELPRGGRGPEGSRWIPE